MSFPLGRSTPAAPETDREEARLCLRGVVMRRVFLVVFRAKECTKDDHVGLVFGGMSWVS